MTVFPQNVNFIRLLLRQEAPSTHSLKSLKTPGWDNGQTELMEPLTSLGIKVQLRQGITKTYHTFLSDLCVL